jgi:hypothetical protein
MKTITVSGLLSASNTDVLANTRLQNLPGAGVVIVELQSSANTTTNNYTVTLNLPRGETPLESYQVPAGATSGALNQNDKTLASYQATQGGKITLSSTLTGTANLAYRVTWKGA